MRVKKAVASLLTLSGVLLLAHLAHSHILRDHINYETYDTLLSLISQCNKESVIIFRGEPHWITGHEVFVMNEGDVLDLTPNIRLEATSAGITPPAFRTLRARNG